MPNEKTNNGKRSPIHVRCYRAKSWLDKSVNLHKEDLDEKFIFCWIALNALYGQPKYLPNQPRSSEESDIKTFLTLLTRLDNGGKIKAAQDSPSIKGFIYDLTTDHYLNDGSWVGWHDRNLDTLSLREKNAFPYKRRESALEILFLQIYVLRKQIFHGCSSHKGSKNREALKKAVVIFEKLLPIFMHILREHVTHPKVMQILGELPYPPTKGGTG